VADAPAVEWLPHALAGRGEEELTVVWHSLFRQYLEPNDWEALQDAFARAAQADARRPIVWLSMEPGADHLVGVELSARTAPEQILASCDDHGPPVRWNRVGAD
jgi:hypothetical protein